MKQLHIALILASLVPLTSLAATETEELAQICAEKAHEATGATRFRLADADVAFYSSGERTFRVKLDFKNRDQRATCMIRNKRVTRIAMNNTLKDPIKVLSQR